ncbi:MAG: hypothetical protein ABH848_03875 [Candidatus Omnitrophota bacterium]
MVNITPEGKLLNLIKQAQAKPRLHSDLKIYTKITVALSVLIAGVLILFLIDIFTFNYKLPEVDLDSLGEIEDLSIPQGSHEDIEIEVPVRKNKVPKESLIKNMELLGIITGDTDQAIIQDKESKETFFLNKGDNFRDLKVFDIKKNTLILDYDGEKIELTM